MPRNLTMRLIRSVSTAAAMALALGVTLSKPGVYTLNATGRAPQAGDLLLQKLRGEAS